MSSAIDTRAGRLTLAAPAVVTRVGSLAGGLAGMNYHRRVDKAGYDRA